MYRVYVITNCSMIPLSLLLGLFVSLGTFFVVLDSNS